MKYISTRGQIAPIDFQDAVMMGLADDGGLVVPQSIPNVKDQLDSWRELSYPELAFEIIRLFVTDIPENDLKALIDTSYGEAFDPDVAVTVGVGDLYLLELWHGPTLAFKDVALQLLGNLFEYILGHRGGRLNILGATSGDTGSAAIYGVRSRAGIDIFMMHPHNRISAIQYQQIASVLDDNVHNMAVEGSFDDCQQIMKALAGDLDFKKRYHIGAVNSVNWARVLAQIVYYFKAVFDVQKKTGSANVRFAVPTGNFGDILAGWYAMQMGLDISQLILATNENDILARFFTSGEYSMGKVHRTLSPAMDIQVASNFERYLFHKLGNDSAKLSQLMADFTETGQLSIETDSDGVVDSKLTAGMGSRDQCLAAVKKYQSEYNYVLDPHTAVGVAVAESIGLTGDPVVCLATAHPAKFPEAIRQATGQDLAGHPDIDKLAGLRTRCQVVANDIEAVRKVIIDTVG